MYNDYYGLAFNPFDKQQIKEQDCFISHDFKEMTSRLEYLKDTRGIGLFTASPGMGKSYCLRCFAKSLNPNLNHMEYLCLSTVSVSDFYKELCSILGVSDRGGKTGMFKSIQEQIYYLYHEKRQPLLLAIDEALRQRITVHYNYEGLTDEESAQYLLHKIESAGGSKTIIEESALSAVIGQGHGNPRILDNIMNSALMLGAQTEKKVIDTEVILAATDSQQLG